MDFRHSISAFTPFGIEWTESLSCWMLMRSQTVCVAVFNFVVGLYWRQSSYSPWDQVQGSLVTSHITDVVEPDPPGVGVSGAVEHHVEDGLFLTTATHRCFRQAKRKQLGVYGPMSDPDPAWSQRRPHP